MKRKVRIITVLIVVLAMLNSKYIVVHASELDVTNPELIGNEDIVTEDIVSISLPCIESASPFDFIMDPLGLISATNGARYGGRSFEEDATLYFENKVGDYDFSSQSDWLEIENRSIVPIDVVIEVEARNTSDVFFSEDISFKEDDRASLYLALMDNDGNIIPLNENGYAAIHVQMKEVSDEDSVQKYSFRLKGACNPNGDWRYVKEQPDVVVSWMVRPVIDQLNKEIISMPSPSATPIASATPSVTPLADVVPSATPTAGIEPSATPIASATPSVLPMASATPSALPVASATPTASSEIVPVETPGDVLVPEQSPTQVPDVGEQEGMEIEETPSVNPAQVDESIDEQEVPGEVSEHAIEPMMELEDQERKN